LRLRHLPALLLLATTVACGSSSPTAPVAGSVASVAATPAPAAATPAPATPATPEPTPAPLCDGCEAPTTNTTQPVRLNLRLYSVVDPDGKFHPGYSDIDELPLGWQATIDVVAKDAFGVETLGSSNVEFSFENGGIARIGGNHPFQRRLIIQQPGRITCRASLDGVRSNDLTLTFRSY
jgi:hypothetical protein